MMRTEKGNVAGGFQSAGQALSCERGRNNTPIHISDIPVKKLSHPGTTRSKRDAGIARNIDIIRCLLAAGETVPEDHPYLLTGLYRADGLRAMRQVHRLYRRYTVLELVHGLWTIRTALPGEVQS